MRANETRGEGCYKLHKSQRRNSSQEEIVSTKKAESDGTLSVYIFKTIIQVSVHLQGVGAKSNAHLYDHKYTLF